LAVPKVDQKVSLKVEPSVGQLVDQKVAQWAALMVDLSDEQ